MDEVLLLVDTCLEPPSSGASLAGAVARNVQPGVHRVGACRLPARQPPVERRGRDGSDHGDGTHSAFPVPSGGRTDRAGVPALEALAGGRHDHSGPGGSETDSHRPGCCHDHVDHLCSYLRGRGSFDNECCIPVIFLCCLGIRHDVHRADPLFYPCCVYRVFYRRTI